MRTRRTTRYIPQYRIMKSGGREVCRCSDRIAIAAKLAELRKLHPYNGYRMELRYHRVRQNERNENTAWTQWERVDTERVLCYNASERGVYYNAIKDNDQQGEI